MKTKFYFRFRKRTREETKDQQKVGTNDAQFFQKYTSKYREDATIKNTKVTSMEETVARFAVTFLASRTL